MAKNPPQGDIYFAAVLQRCQSLVLLLQVLQFFVNCIAALVASEKFTPIAAGFKAGKWPTCDDRIQLPRVAGVARHSQHSTGIEQRSQRRRQRDRGKAVDVTLPGSD